MRLADALAAGGRRVVLYNFPYTEARRRVPDKPAVLEATVAAVAAHAPRARWAPPRLVLGGKSMGGRIASQAVRAGPAARTGSCSSAIRCIRPAASTPCATATCPRSRAPMLFVQGTRDAFARPDLLAPVLGGLGDRATLHSIEGGDHSFAVPRRGGPHARRRWRRRWPPPSRPGSAARGL